MLMMRNSLLQGQAEGGLPQGCFCGQAAVEEVPQYHHRPSPGSMSTLLDRGDYSSGEGCCQKERGGREDGEADARG